MRQTVSVALVDTPTTEYGNVLVDLASYDDVILEATVNNRQGSTLAIFKGPFTSLPPVNGFPVWEITTDEGPVRVQGYGGCGCGGVTVIGKDQP